jgi:ATP-dependent Lhr-like helicase
LDGLLPQKFGRYSFLDIARYSKLDSRAITKRLWDLAWQGRVTNDAFEIIRRGIMTDFAPFSLKREGGRPSRSAFNRWATTRPLSGNWYAVDREGIERDPIDEAELVKDRVRQLFKRYGLVFRELLANELPLFQWARVFKALRVMELSGEILSGYFFEGIPGVQFISHEAFRFLNEPLPNESVYWLNATDPASLCGIRLEGLKGLLPSRLTSTHLVYRGKALVLISRRNGRVLEFLTPPDDPYILDYLVFFKSC